MSEGSVPNARNATALRVYSANRPDAEKAWMLQFLLDGGEPSLIEADLDNALLFVGFAPDPSISLTESATIRVTPRQELPTLEKQLNYIDVYKKLTQFNNAARGCNVQTLVLYKTPWVEEWAEIVWYASFKDEVSLRFSDGGYKVVFRKELF